MAEHRGAGPIEFHQVSKRFGNVLANDSVSFPIAPNSIHGVVGENGAGKSTIMKVLYGLYAPDSGHITVDGNPVQISSPQVAIEKGIGMVHQHFMLVPTLSAWRNIILGAEPTLGRLNEAAVIAKLQQLQEDCGVQIDLEKPAEDLAIGQQQQIEILKLLYRNAGMLILDEPTAVLTPQETDALFERLRKLHGGGKSIVLISHKLREILALTQTVTVLRRGKVVDTVPTKELTAKSLAELIVGRSLIALPQRTPVSENASTMLSLQNVSLEKKKKVILSDLCFEIKAGEILGVAGVEGNGQLELVEVLSQIEKHYSGNIELMSHPLSAYTSVQAKQSGFGVVPPDRHTEGLVLSFSVEENFLLGHAREPQYSKAGWLRADALAAAAKEKIQEFDIRPPDASLPVSALSGGNQQKILIGREATGKTRFLIVSHPTRGVDIGAIEFIHSHLIRLRDAGAAILLISSELDEILALSDRVMVLFNGKVQGVVDRKDADECQLGLWMTGGAVA